MENILQDDLIVWEEIKDKNWVIFYGPERYFIDEETKEAIMDGIKRKLSVININGIIWTDKFSRILPISMVKEADYLKKGYKKSTREIGKWFDPRSNPIVYYE